MGRDKGSFRGIGVSYVKGANARMCAFLWRVVSQRKDPQFSLSPNLPGTATAEGDEEHTSVDPQSPDNMVDAMKFVSRAADIGSWPTLE